MPATFTSIPKSVKTFFVLNPLPLSGQFFQNYKPDVMPCKLIAATRISQSKDQITWPASPIAAPEKPFIVKIEGSTLPSTQFLIDVYKRIISPFLPVQQLL